MRLPKQASGVRYLGSTDFNTQVTFTQPSNGNAADGTSMPETAVATTWASISMWRGKQEDKPETTVATASYKVVIRYPQTWSIDGGMNILIRGQRHNIDSFFDPDGNRNELHIWTWTADDTVNK